MRTSRSSRGRPRARCRATCRPSPQCSPDYAPEEIAEIAQRLRKEAGFRDKPTAAVADGGEGLMDKVKDKLG